MHLFRRVHHFDPVALTFKLQRVTCCGFFDVFRWLFKSCTGKVSWTLQRTLLSSFVRWNFLRHSSLVALCPFCFPHLSWLKQNSCVSKLGPMRLIVPKADFRSFRYPFSPLETYGNLICRISWTTKTHNYSYTPDSYSRFLYLWLTNKIPKTRLYPAVAPASGTSDPHWSPLTIPLGLNWVNVYFEPYGVYRPFLDHCPIETFIYRWVFHENLHFWIMVPDFFYKNHVFSHLFSQNASP